MASGLLSSSVLAAALLALLGTACHRSRGTGDPRAEARIDELVEPHPDIAARDLYHGVGGPDLVPRTDVEYRFLEADESGVNTNYDIEDPSGRKWDAKFGSEVKSEVVASR